MLHGDIVHHTVTALHTSHFSLLSFTFVVFLFPGYHTYNAIQFHFGSTFNHFNKIFYTHLAYCSFCVRFILMGLSREVFIFLSFRTVCYYLFIKMDEIALDFPTVYELFMIALCSLLLYT